MIGGFQLYSRSVTLYHLTPHGHLGYITKLSFESPCPVLCAANIRRPGISTSHRHSHLTLPIHTLVEWNLHFFMSREIHVGQCRIRTTNPSFCRRTCYHWTRIDRYCANIVENVNYFLLHSDCCNDFNKYFMIQYIFQNATHSLPNIRVINYTVYLGILKRTFTQCQMWYQYIKWYQKR